MLNLSSAYSKCAKYLFGGVFFIAAFFVFGQSKAFAGFLYALNDAVAGSQIYGFQVDETTGALTLLPGFPLAAPSGGNNSIVSERMIADKANNRLYIINDGADTVSAYSVNTATGALTELPFSPITLGLGTWNSIAVHPSGSPLIVSNGSSTIGGGGVRSFTITPTTATPAAGNPYPTTGTTAFSSSFSNDGNYFYVGGNTGTGIYGFSVNPVDGSLTALPGAPFDTGAASPIAYATDSVGRLFTMNSNDDVRAFTSTMGVLSPVAGNPFPPSGLTQRRFGLVHPNQNFYVIAGNSGNNVGVFQISGSGSATTLTPVTGSPFPTGGTTANVLAINQDGTFLYVANRISRNITRFNFNTATGELSGQTVQPSSTLGAAGAINGMAYVPDEAAVPAEARADFDGDGRTDVSVFRPSDGIWYLQRSTAGFGAVQWGGANDILVPEDYDADGKTDTAVFQPLNRYWFILRSENNTVLSIAWGATGDIPVPGDYDGDNRADAAVFRPAAGAWYILKSSDGMALALAFGQSGDIPVPGDFDGDNLTNLAVFRPSTGQWFYSLDYVSPGTNFHSQTWGLSTDQPVHADYDGDGKDDIAVFRPSEGIWYILRSSDSQLSAIYWGQTGDVPAPGDYDGDGKSDQAVFRDGVWFINNSVGGFEAYSFGASNDVPVPSAYIP